MSNKQYLCIMRYQSKPEAQSSDQTKSAPSPAQMEEMYAKFNAWKEKFKDNIVDMGGKLGDGKVVKIDAVSDGPFSEINEIAGGYMIVSADSMELAVQVAQESPGIYPGSSVEVREIQQHNG
ncbi:MAG: hypothetical protein HRU38_24430 [Saccharospirillaceae bacterium]|nr:YciI family protein [Pseudomonadales bacterium]NRB81769.1 hypothetical protein [Saccharospirillaceae bacterium]